MSSLELLIIHYGRGIPCTGSGDYLIPDADLQVHKALWHLLLEESLWVILGHVFLVLHCRGRRGMMALVPHIKTLEYNHSVPSHSYILL